MARRTAAKANEQPEKPPARRIELRRFLLEFISVAGGVLLALIVDQTAENWREHRRVVDQRQAMDREIAEFSEIFQLRVRVGTCIASKLDALEASVRGEGPAAPLTGVGRPPFFFSGRGAWNGDNSDQVSRYLGAENLARYSELYQGMEQYAALNAAEQDTWVPFLALEGDTTPLTPDRRTRIREAIAQARNQQLLLNAIAVQMLDQAKVLGVTPKGALAAKARDAGVCKTLATIGQAGSGKAQ
jgi:hypothetical protein